ncbi:MAG: aminotransferase class V-fold PLP-dependent enzyme, partial [Promethearchaeota archaeon]
VTGVAAIGKVITILERVGMDVIEAQERILTRNILLGLNKIQNIKIFSIKDPESPRFNRKGGTIVFNLKNVPHNLVAKELTEYGAIGVRNGCFCANMLVKHLLKINPFRVSLQDLV